MKRAVMLHLLVTAAFLPPFAPAQDSRFSVQTSSSQGLPQPSKAAAPGCSPDRRSDPKSGVVVSEAVLEGTTTISSVELSAIKSKLVGACFDEQQDVIEGVVRAAFQDMGFAQVDVKDVALKASDTLAVPKPVSLKVDVEEGPRFRFGEITFTGNHVFSGAKLRAVFPVKKGELFQRSKIANGLSEIRKLYRPRGYADLLFQPDIEFPSTGTVLLGISVLEGPQYRMGKLQICARKEIADRLGSGWNLQEGAVFDLDYPQAFIDSSHSLPSEFSPRDVLLVRNCPEASIGVYVIVDQTDPRLQNLSKDVPCKKEDESSSTGK